VSHSSSSVHAVTSEFLTNHEYLVLFRRGISGGAVNERLQ
jgi:hypothetical protein